MWNSSDDEDDPVEQEIDIFLAKGLAEKLLLFQYPVRPSNATYDFTPHLAARIKPTQQKVELELGISVDSPTYCYTRGEQIAHAVDSGGPQGPDKKLNFPSSVMDRQLLSSVRATEDSSKYAAGIYCNGAIHITPIKSIYQLHPSFTYFDKAEENHKKATAALAKNDDDVLSEEETSLAKPVNLRFSKVQNKNKRNEVKQGTEEKWIETQFYQPQDRRAVMERNLLLCHQDDFESPEFTVTSRDYLKILSPSEKQGTESPADLPHGVLSLLKLKGMSLTDQIKALLITAKVLQFTQLCALLGGGMDVNAVLTGLTQYAMLVQGCWVVKSDVLYPEGTKSHVSGLDAAKLWPSRDYVMFCFNRKRVLSRKEVASNTRLPTEELREVLEQIGKQRPAQGWEFMLNTDNDFLKGHPEICLNQISSWKQKFKEISEVLHLNEEYSDSDWNESNFCGLFGGDCRKSSSSRTRHRTQSLSENEKGKSKNRKCKTHTSKEELPSTHIKEEQVSPLMETDENCSDFSELRLDLDNEATNLIQKSSRKNISSKKSENMDSLMKKKSPLKLSKSIFNIEKKKTTTENEQVRTLADGDMNMKSAFDEDKGSEYITNNNKGSESSEENENGMEVEKNVRKKKRRKLKVLISDDEENDVGRNASSNCIKDIFEEDAVKAVNEVEVDLTNVSADEHPYCDTSDEIFVPPVATRGGMITTYVEKPPSDIFIKELKKFCREAIQSGCLSLFELKEVLHMRQQEAGNILCTGVTDDLLIKCVIESGACELSINWSEPNNIPYEKKRIFIYRHLGDSSDKFRSVIIDCFSASQSLRRKDIFESFNKSLGEAPSSHIYTKIISEFCQNHNGQWYLNGTYNTLQKFSNS